MKKIQPNIFGEAFQDVSWENEWRGMPEFEQKKQAPYAQIMFRFATEQDLERFSEIIGQKLNKKTKSAWHPFRSHWGGGRKVWKHEP